MEKIASFKVDHTKLLPGLYVSRVDEYLQMSTTTFDLRIIQPNKEEAMDDGSIHTLEHILATYFRNAQEKEQVVYFGPMGCKTGFYLIEFGKKEALSVLDKVKKAFEFVVNFKGEIPGASAKECGNYKLQNLDGAKFYARKYLCDLEKYKSFKY